MQLPSHSIKQYLTYIWILLLEVGLFTVMFVGGFYRSFLFRQTLESIAALSMPALIRSILLLLVMSIPVLVTLYLLNGKFFKIPLYSLIVIHLLFVFLSIMFLEVLLRSVS